VLNQTVTFANFDYDVSETLTFTSRNGYNIAFTAATAIGDGAGGTAMTYNGNGLATFGGTVWGNTNTTARTLTVNGTGATLVSGNVTASGALHEFTKNGTGTVTVQGTGSTFTGDTNINNGTLIVTDFRSLTNNSAIINIGSNASNTNLSGSNNNGAGVLTIGTATAPSAAGLTTSKVINLAGTTNGATINASQSGANPVIFNSAFTATGINAKTLTLGGTNAADNIINGAIVNNATGQTQTAANYAIGATTITLASVEGIVVGDTISGAGIPAATTITAVNTGTKVVTISAATTAAITGTTTITTPNVQNPTSLLKTDVGTWVLAGTNTYTGSTSISGGTLKLKANAATTSTVIGEAAGNTVVFNANTTAGTAAGTLELVGFSGSATTETLGALTPTAGAATVKLTANSVSPSTPICPSRPWGRLRRPPASISSPQALAEGWWRSPPRHRLRPRPPRFSAPRTSKVTSILTALILRTSTAPTRSLRRPTQPLAVSKTRAVARLSPVSITS
jgi:autotransporter-associated beta strand protein